MSKRVVDYKIDPGALPPLSKAQKIELAQLAVLPDAQIDSSDIAPLEASFWKDAIRNPYYKPVKQATTVRIDADVLLWLKSAGKGYQTRINAILREAMLHKHGVRR